MNRMEMGWYQPAWTPIWSIVLHGAGGQIRRLSLQRPTHTQWTRIRSRAPPWTFTSGILPLSLNLDSLYIPYVRTSQICYVILHHRRGFESSSSGDWTARGYLLAGERPAATGTSCSSRLLVFTQMGAFCITLNRSNIRPADNRPPPRHPTALPSLWSGWESLLRLIWCILNLILCDGDTTRSYLKQQISRRHDRINISNVLMGWLGAVGGGGACE